MCCSHPDGAAAAFQSPDSRLTHPAQAQDALQIVSTTFEAEGVRLPPQQLKELKAIAAERDEQRKRVTREMRNGAAYWTKPSIFFGPRPSRLG